MGKLKFNSNFLFPKTDFVIGSGSVINVCGSYFKFNETKSPQEADRLALENDWGMVGEDLRTALEKQNNKHVRQ